MNVLVTGGTGLVGRSLIEGFLSKNFNVFYIYTNKKKSNLLLQKIKKKFKNVPTPLLANFKKKEDVFKFSNKLKNIKINFLVNNARNLENLNNNNKTYDVADKFENEFFLSVIVPYILSVELSKNLKSIVNDNNEYDTLV